MGGDTFEGVQKLTNQQYQVMVPELIDQLSHMCRRIQSYIPLPQKQIHGDIDFLVILKPQFNPKDVIDHLKLEKYILNNNQTINSVYKNKQVDFFFPNDDTHFNSARFYKSYSGIGAFLGVFLPSKEIKLTTTGLYAIGYEKHIKFQYLITHNIEEIMKFYGLSYERFQEGFKTRLQLFKFLEECKFLNEEQFIKHDLKHASKLTKFFAQHLIKKGPKERPFIHFKDAKYETLQYFHKQEQFQIQFTKQLDEIKRKRAVNDKFNATHVMDRFKISGKDFNKYKKEFRAIFQTQQQYFQYVENTELENIIEDFKLKCNIKDPEVQEKGHD